MKHEGENPNVAEIVALLQAGKVLIVNARRRNGLILYKDYHAEFAGPGSAVGGVFDLNCRQVLPVGNFSLLEPESQEERQKAYLIRRQWIRFTKQVTEDPEPLQRAQKILTQFEAFFEAQTVAQMPDEAFAMLVGVLPQTIGMVRRASSDLEGVRGH
jgi:hypothetical protein